MPEISETAEISYCASILAKAYKLEQETVFANFHDELGKKFNAEDLTKIEDLARNYTELPIHVLDHKISWLRPHVQLPSELTDFLTVNVGNVTNAESVKSGGDTAGSPGTSQMNNPSPSVKDDPLSVKKNNKKLKQKQKQADDASGDTKEENIEHTEKTDEITAIEGPEPSDPSSSTKRKKKKKKKKKSKNGNKSNEIEPEKEEMKPEEPREWKKEEETVVVALDSGIGSCVASGGEDKSSVLSGGTVESNGEQADAATPVFNFEYNGDNIVNDFLQTEKVFIEHIDESSSSNREANAKNSNRYEISFGIPFNDESKEEEQPTVVVQRSKKSKNKKSGAKSDVRKISGAQKTEFKEKNDYKISFGTPSDEAVSIVPQQLPDVKPSKPKMEKFDSKNSTFDHKGAVLFLWSEWNRTVNE